MRNFTADASAALGGPGWLADRRSGAIERLASIAVPSADDEVWRYSPIGKLDLDAFAPARDTPVGDDAAALVAEFGGGAVAIVRNGRVVSIERGGLPESVTLAAAAAGDVRAGLGEIVKGDDYFVVLNDAFVSDAVVLEVPPRVAVEQPVLIVHWCDATKEDEAAPTSFPRTVVRVGEGAQAAVIEVIAGPAGRSLVVPVGEMSVGDRGHLAYVMVQDLGWDAWHLARLGATVGRDATLRSFTAGLGGDYDRCRVDAAALGDGGSTQLTTVYLGSGDQVHDIRTLQDHVAPRTTSDLLCKGAVAERSQSIYTGLIRVRNGAAKSDAMQTNHNLVLDPTAHADSVPNLDIEENDVRCSHASSVGPVSEDQRYYLESRGLSPARAERLIVLGFFDDIVERAPVAAAIGPLRQRIGQRLGALLGRGGADG
ncbi:MAG: SufB/SufD family protein [Acidimicrobiales bacterium]